MSKDPYEIRYHPVQLFGKTSAGSYFPIGVVQRGSIGYLATEIPSVAVAEIDTVKSGSISITHGSVTATVTRIGTVSEISSLKSGSVGILEQPLSVNVGSVTNIKSGSISITHGSISTVTEITSLKSGSVGILEQPLSVNVGSVTTIKGGSISVSHGSITVTHIGTIGEISSLKSGSIGILGQPIGVRTYSNYYVSFTIFDNKHIASGSTITSGWYGIGSYKIKTFSAKSTVPGSLIIEVRPTTSPEGNIYYSCDLPANTFVSKSFTEAFCVARISIYMSGSPSGLTGTVNTWLGLQAV